MASKIFEEALAQVTPENDAFVRMSIQTAKRIQELMDENGMSQTDLANALGKSPSEISKWLSGLHNFTMKSLAKLEVVLGAPLMAAPPRFDEKAFDESIAVIAQEVKLAMMKSQGGFLENPSEAQRPLSVSKNISDGNPPIREARKVGGRQ